MEPQFVETAGVNSQEGCDLSASNGKGVHRVAAAGQIPETDESQTWT